MINMNKSIVVSVLLLVATSALADVLIVADEFPAMEVLAAKLKSEENISSKVIAQKDLPEKLSASSWSSSFRVCSR